MDYNEAIDWINRVVNDHDDRAMMDFMVNNLTSQNDTLRAENARLRDALTEIRDGEYEDASSCARIAKEALK